MAETKLKNQSLASGIAMTSFGTYAWNSAQTCTSTTVPVKLTNGYVDVTVPAYKKFVWFLSGGANCWMNSTNRGTLQIYQTVDTTDTGQGYIGITAHTNHQTIPIAASGTYDNSANASTKVVRLGLWMVLIDAGTMNHDSALFLYGMYQFI